MASLPLRVPRQATRRGSQRWWAAPLHPTTTLDMPLLKEIKSDIEVFHDDIRREAHRLQVAADSGHKKAASVITLYQMHQQSPNDPAALGLCMAAFNEWVNSNG